MPSITFKPVVYANHRKDDGTYNVKIRITFKRVSRKLATTIYARKEDLTRSLAIKNAALLDKANDLIRTMRSCLDDLNIFALETMTVDDVVEHIKRRMRGDGFTLDFFEWSDEAIRGKNGSTAARYKMVVGNFRKFIGRDRLDISEITPPLMREYESWLKDEFGSDTHSASYNPSIIAHIHSLARQKYNNEMADKPLIANPFEFYRPPKPRAPGHRDIDLDIVRLMYKERETLEGRERMGVDWFLISFMLMGANIADLHRMEREKDGVLHYCRQKTRDRRDDKAEMFVRVEAIARPIVDEHTLPGGGLQFDISRYSSKSNVLCFINDGLDQWRKRHDLPKFTHYAARHTWATTAYSCGINPAHITDALCHVDQARKMDSIYIRKDWKVIWEANREVLEFVFGDVKK